MKLSETVTIRGMEIRNRIAKPAMATFAHRPGLNGSTETIIDFYNRSANGGGAYNLRFAGPFWFHNITEEQWDNVLDVNLKAMFFYSQAAAREMIEAGKGGKIVNIASGGALRPHGFCAHYDTSKGGVISLTKTLALEFAPHNIQVNAIAPGGTMTPGVIEDAKGLQQLREELEEPPLNVWSVNIPWHRWAEPDDMAKVALFLVSEATDYMTGVLLPVDGGRLLL